MITQIALKIIELATFFRLFNLFRLALCLAFLIWLALSSQWKAIVIFLIAVILSWVIMFIQGIGTALLSYPITLYKGRKLILLWATAVPKILWENLVLSFWVCLVFPAVYIISSLESSGMATLLAYLAVCFPVSFDLPVEETKMDLLIKPDKAYSSVWLSFTAILVEISILTYGIAIVCCDVSPKLMTLFFWSTFLILSSRLFFWHLKMSHFLKLEREPSD